MLEAAKLPPEVLATATLTVKEAQASGRNVPRPRPSAYTMPVPAVVSGERNTVMSRSLLLFLLCSCVTLAACGGGGGGSGGIGGEFLTADSRGMFGGGGPGAGAPVASDGSADQAAGALERLAREIEEADLLRVEGDLVYVLNPHRGLVVADLGRVALRGRLPFVGFPREMYVRGARGLVLLNRAEGGGELLDVDLSDPDAPRLVARLPFAGWLDASRLVGDVLYVVSGGAVFSFRVAAGVAAADAEDLPFAGGFVHATDRFLAVAGGRGFDTTVALVDISDPSGAIALRGSLELSGYVADEFKLHFGAGTLRVVTHDWTDGGLSRLFTVDVSDLSNPRVLGTLRLARGEQLFATRFTDEEAYLVTFERIDPLWVVDLRDPSNPRVAGELQVPGWSTHIVPVGRKLVALGVDPADGWKVIVSLFDVADPAAPRLLDREEFGRGWSSAFEDVKAFGVFPDVGLVLVPFSGDTNGLAVVDLGASTLALRGLVETSGGVQRGFPHARGICAVTPEEIVLVDPVTLAKRGAITIAELVVDAARLPDGRLLSLVLRGDGARLGSVSLPLFPDGLHVHGARAAVTGWTDSRRAAYVVDFASDPPAVSSRIDLGGVLDPGFGPPGAAVSDRLWMPVAYNAESLLTPGGKLVVRTVPPPDAPGVTIGSGGRADGYAVVDLPAAALHAWIHVRGGFVSGAALDGETLAFTYARFAGYDEHHRPLARHELFRVDLAAKSASQGVNVPGWLVQARGALAFTVEEVWRGDWAIDAFVVASRVEDGASERLSSLPLPMGAYDFRAAGATFYFTEGGGYFVGQPLVAGAMGAPWFEVPATKIRTLKLGASIAAGPAIEVPDSFATLLLPEDGSALVVRDGVVVERYEVSGPSARRDWSAELGAWPLRARADTTFGRYLVALGYAGVAELP